MAEICRGVLADSEAPSSAACEADSRAGRRRRMEIRRFKFDSGISTPTNTSSDSDTEIKRQKLDVVSAPSSASLTREGFDNAVENCISAPEPVVEDESDDSSSKKKDTAAIFESQVLAVRALGPSHLTPILNVRSLNTVPKFGFASVCGRRREMEDAVAVHPSFFRRENDSVDGWHYFAVYDGHGCSHVAMRCRDRLHELLKEELLSEKLLSSLVPAEENDRNWKEAMERSFNRMDKEVVDWSLEDRVHLSSTSSSSDDNIDDSNNILSCRCEFQSPDQSGAVGSTAIVAVVTPRKIIVANCGDSRAVMYRNGEAIPLSSDHKPDRPDELIRIEEAGGRVIYWDGPRVLGVLAMSRAIGDNYLKPFVCCEPEVTITDRTPGDECLILASDGLWDVVSNDTACGVVRMCLCGKVPASVGEEGEGNNESSSLSPPLPAEVMDKACTDASTLLTKLALARRSTDNVSVVVLDLRKDT